MAEYDYKPMLLKDLTMREVVERFDDWHVVEPKLDGIRVGSFANALGEVALLSRGGHDITHRFLGVSRAIAEAVPDHTFHGDGELLAFTEAGEQSLRGVMSKHPREACYMFYDLLELDGEDIRSLTFAERRGLLEGIVDEDAAPARVRLTPSSPATLENVEKIYNAGCEGIVVKDKRGRYQPGKRRDESGRFKFSDYEHK